MEKIIKIILTILLFLCLANWPYGYYEMVRFIALIGFGILSYRSYIRNEKTSATLYLALAILFQPLFKIALGRTLWNIVDVIVGTCLIINLIYEITFRKDQQQ